MLPKLQLQFKCQICHLKGKGTITEIGSSEILLNNSSDSTCCLKFFLIIFNFKQLCNSLFIGYFMEIKFKIVLFVQSNYGVYVELNLLVFPENYLIIPN